MSAPRNQQPSELHDRPISVVAVVLPVPAATGAIPRGGTPPRIVSSTSPTSQTGEASGSLILVPGSPPYSQLSDGGTPIVLATDADLVTAEGRLDDLEAMLVEATAIAGAKVVLPEPTGGGTSTVTLQAPALSASRTITVPDADVTLADIAANASRLDDLEAITVAATAGAGAKVVLAEPTGGGTSTVTLQAPALSADRVITVPDADVTLADIALNTTERTTLQDQMVVATIAVADASGGATDALLTLTLLRADNSTAIASARQVMVYGSSQQYNHFASLSNTTTFGTATAGSIIATGNGWALVQTSAAGAFACTVTNSADETVYFAVDSASAGVSDIATRCHVVGSNSDAATWSA